MAFFKPKRLSALALALILTFFSLLFPLLDVYGSHDHSCSVNKCILCLASNAISFLRDISIFHLLYAGTALISIILLHIFNSYLKPTVSSPVSLKTKITS